MLKIKKDNVEMVVTTGMFEDVFEGMGYKIVQDEKIKEVKEEQPVEEKEVEQPQVVEQPRAKRGK